jgi:endonuclease/exonuclease/phosphatase family metal-dependent hydrolase
MNLTLLTYNVLYNSALTKFEKVLELTKPDIVCLQEIDTDEENLKRIEKHGYKLADYSNSFIKFGTVYGLATFYNPETLRFNDSTTLSLPRSYYEFFLVLLRGGNNPRTVLKTEFELKKDKKRVTNYNLHLTAWGTNGIRVRQIKATLDDLDLKTDHPVIISGDFNYPYQRKQFEEIIETYGLKEATNNLFSTFEGKILKLFAVSLKLDYILYKNTELIKTEKVLNRDSDHYPILSQFAI